MSIRFYCDSIQNRSKNFVFIPVTGLDECPEGLKKFSKAMRWAERGYLWILDLKYIPQNLVAAGVYDKLDISDPAKIQAVDIFRKILRADNTDLQLYMYITSPTFRDQANLLIHRFKLDLVSHPFREYRSKNTGNYVIQWNNEQFKPGVDTYTRRPTKTFRKIVHQSLTHAHGVMRDVSQSLQYGQEAFDRSMKAWFMPMPNCALVDGLPSQYIVFVHCDNQEHLREFYTDSDVGQLIFEIPEDKEHEPVGWKFTVRSALPACETPGNLTLQVRRPKGDASEIPAEFPPHPAMQSTDVYLWPTISDVAPRRLVNAANLIRQPSPDIKELQRIVQAPDLSEDPEYVSPFLQHQAINDEETAAILSSLFNKQRQKF